MATKTTQRSLKQLRERGYDVQVMERYNAFARRRIDLFNFADILAIGNGEILAVQTTSSSNLADRKKKILAEPRAKVWLESGGTIEVHGWALRGPRGKRKTYQCRTVVITLEDFHAQEEDIQCGEGGESSCPGAHRPSAGGESSPG